jgi:hypothetical protein
MKTITDTVSLPSHRKEDAVSSESIRRRCYPLGAGAWWRRVVRGVTFALVLVAFATAAPPAARAATHIGYDHEDIYHYDSLGQPHWRGSMQMVVYSDRRKDLKVCDQSIDPYKVIVEIDPSGGGPPETLMYADENYANPGCGNYTFWYPVRKWRTLLWHIGERFYLNEGPWRYEPLPRPDF